MTHDPNPLLAFVWSGWTATWPTQLLALIWVGWLISWGVGSFFSGRTEKHVRTWDSRAYRIPILIGAVLLTPWTAQVLGEKPLWHFGNAGIYVLAALTLAGCLFTWWARIHLGRFWSNAITRKEGHRVIDTGPYGLVRHPIYTGLIGAMIATGIAVGTATALLGTALIAFGKQANVQVLTAGQTVSALRSTVRSIDAGSTPGRSRFTTKLSSWR